MEDPKQVAGRLLRGAVVFACVFSVCRAQAQWGIRPNSLSLQNTLSHRVYGVESPSVRALEESFFSDLDASLDYAYRHVNYTGGYNRSESHAVNPGVYLEHDSNTSLTASFLYQRSALRSDFPTESYADLYAPSLSFDEEVLHFFGVNTESTSFTLQADLAYAKIYGVSRTQVRGGSFESRSESDVYYLGPAAIFVQRLLTGEDKIGKFNRLALTIAPSSEGPFSSHSFNYQSSLFSLLAELDYGIARAVFADLVAVWFHDVSNNQNVTLHDWAMFGAGIVYKPNPRWRLKLGYAYEAFNPYFDSHNISAHAEFHF